MRHLSLAAPVSVIIPAALAWAAAALALFRQLAPRAQPPRRRPPGVVAPYVDLAPGGHVAAPRIRGNSAAHCRAGNRHPDRRLRQHENARRRARQRRHQPPAMAGAQLARQFWQPLQAKAKVSVEPFAAPSTNENAINGTDLNLALEGTLAPLQKSQGRPPVDRWRLEHRQIALGHGHPISRAEHPHFHRPGRAAKRRCRT